MDVAAILQAFLRRSRLGGTLRTGAELLGLGSAAVTSGCSARATARSPRPVLVNAAGAWADQLAALAGVGPVGLVPKRRTAIVVAPPAGVDVRGWPAVIDVGEQFYFKPDAGRLLASPADETPSEPCDAQPEELDVAVAVDRVEQATDLAIRRIEHRWAGLRSFVADKTPVVGFDPRAPGFFWLAGQGGYGIRPRPVLAAITAHLVANAPLPPWFGDGVDIAALRPDRLLAAVADRNFARAADGMSRSALEGVSGGEGRMPVLDETARGVFLIAVTPFTDDGALDLPSTDRVVDFYLERGVDGLTLLGVMGEAPKLTADGVAQLRPPRARPRGGPGAGRRRRAGRGLGADERAGQRGDGPRRRRRDGRAARRA